MSKKSFSPWGAINNIDVVISVISLGILVVIVSVQVFCR